MARTTSGDAWSSFSSTLRHRTSIWSFVLSACEGAIIFYYSHLRFIIQVFLLFMDKKNCRRRYTQMNFLFSKWKLMLVSYQKDETKVFVSLKNELKFFHQNACCKKQTFCCAANSMNLQRVLPLSKHRRDPSLSYSQTNHAQLSDCPRQMFVPKASVPRDYGREC